MEQVSSGTTLVGYSLEASVRLTIWSLSTPVFLNLCETAAL